MGDSPVDPRGFNEGDLPVLPSTIFTRCFVVPCFFNMGDFSVNPGGFSKADCAVIPRVFNKVAYLVNPRGFNEGACSNDPRVLTRTTLTLIHVVLMRVSVPLIHVF
jgi:hypothetical protein